MASVAKGGERAEVAEVQADCTEGNAAARQNGDRDAGGHQVSRVLAASPFCAA